MCVNVTGQSAIVKESEISERRRPTERFALPAPGLFSFRLPVARKFVKQAPDRFRREVACLELVDKRDCFEVHGQSHNQFGDPERIHPEVRIERCAGYH